MRKITKIIYDDGSELSQEEIKPMEEIKENDNGAERYHKRRKYNNQFRKFQIAILDDIDSDIVEQYALDNFDLINEDEVEDKNIDDFGDAELVEELKSRKLLGGKTSIISENFLNRFSKIMQIENQSLLDNVLSEFETKLNI